MVEADKINKRNKNIDFFIHPPKWAADYYGIYKIGSPEKLFNFKDKFLHIYQQELQLLLCNLQE